MKINLSPTRDSFYSQLNNEVEPYIACQVTSMVAGLTIGGFGLVPINALKEQERFKQPEDKLRHYMLNDDDVQSFWRKSHPRDLNVPAPEWSDCMVYAVNKIYGKNIVYFASSLKPETIISDLEKGLPIYTSMRYMENRNSSGKLSPIPGHIVLIVGIDGDNLIINDPFKNHLTGDWDGHANIYTPAEFAEHNKGYAIRYIK